MTDDISEQDNRGKMGCVVQSVLCLSCCVGLLFHCVSHSLLFFIDLGHVLRNERTDIPEVVSLIMVCFCDAAACIG